MKELLHGGKCCTQKISKGATQELTRIPPPLERCIGLTWPKAMLEKRPYLRNGQLLPRHPQPTQGLSLLPGQESVFMTWDRHEVWFYACPLDNLGGMLLTTRWPGGHNLKGQGCFRPQSDNDRISASPYVMEHVLFCLMSDVGGRLRLCGLRHCWCGKGCFSWLLREQPDGSIAESFWWAKCRHLGQLS